MNPHAKASATSTPQARRGQASRKLLLATGVADELPEKPGSKELWGRGVYHCRYCRGWGWEVRDRPLAVLNSREETAEHAG